MPPVRYFIYWCTIGTKRGPVNRASSRPRAALAAVREQLRDRQVLHLIGLIGLYMTVCRLLETTGVEPDPIPPSKMGIVLPGQSK
jgi:hypothetical protein